ncbi:MAG: nucleotidyltransferase domain-containing protein, partial [Nanoarchaeota archaeon]
MDYKTVEDNTIFLGVVGSYAYGTNMPDGSSDFDESGCCIPPKEYYIGTKKFEQADKWVDLDGNKIDKVIYSIDKIINLCLDNNPNCLDLLFLPERCIKFLKPEYEKLLSIRDAFISKKCKHTFSGYAFSQLDRIKTHRSYLFNPIQKPLREEFDLPDRSIFPDTQIELIAKLSTDYISQNSKDGFQRELTQIVDNEMSQIFRKYLDSELVPLVIQEFKKGQTEYLRTFESISSLYLKDEFLGIAANEMKYLSAYKNWKRYEDWKKNRNPKRQVLEAKCGFDCYSDDTEFLTENGWKKYENVSENDKLATVFVNWDGNYKNMGHRRNLTLEYQKYQDKFEGNYTGNMYNFIGHHLDVLVTPNHNMLYREYSRKNDVVLTELILSESASMPDCFEFLNHIESNPRNFSDLEFFKDIKISRSQYLSLMGWFLSDGTFCFKRGKL